MANGKKASPLYLQLYYNFVWVKSVTCVQCQGSADKRRSSESFSFKHEQIALYAPKISISHDRFALGS